MQSSLKLLRLTRPQIMNETSRGYVTKVTLKLKNKAAKDLANDETGNHTHVGRETCVLPDCGTKRCAGLCDQRDKTKIEGHNTHKPPIGRFTRFIASEDANEDAKPQYFVPTNTKKEISEKERQQYGSNIKQDPVQQAFVDKNSDKYD